MRPKGRQRANPGYDFYGNAGIREPLDFTVFGPAANEASRIAATCRPVDRLFYCQQRIPTVEGAFAAAGPLLAAPCAPSGRVHEKLSGPELILGLLIALILPERGGATVLHGPDVDLGRRPASIATPCAFRAEDDDPVTLGKNVIDLNPERTV